MLSIYYVAVCTDVAGGPPRRIRGLHLYSREHTRQAGEGDILSTYIYRYLVISTDIYLYLLLCTAGGDADGGSQARDPAHQPGQDLP